ncbi:hypothetical protein I2485_06105 [Nesterenkonia sp. E16_7]|uniref:hypothetical protein n=1 Tax=unclassified Nesterenkonia TaxID=2629769 RepID=UPI001A92F132|nr:MULTISPECIES: hypothetical protein [unclassified Nesterenkonia]MBO0596825.1 hypothetical protein [Nesterenkonia sp. E16_10]MBO0598223.1 hypothetical protein [Nesterenkonia sp. E16_7]
MSWSPPNSDPPEDQGPESSDASLDAHLRNSAPPGTPVTAALQAELEQLAVASREDARSRRRASRSGLSRGAAMGLAALALLGTATAAVAVVELRSYWSDLGVEPHVNYSFELPSGAECEVELRMKTLGPAGMENIDDYSMTAEQDAFVREMYSDVQDRVDAMVEREGFLDRARARSDAMGLPEGKEETDDVAYFSAVDSGLSLQLQDEYGAEMMEVGVGGYSFGHSCPGADFEGSWMDELGDMDTYETQGEGSEG